MEATFEDSLVWSCICHEVTNKLTFIRLCINLTCVWCPLQMGTQWLCVSVRASWGEMHLCALQRNPRWGSNRVWGVIHTSGWESWFGGANGIGYVFNFLFFRNVLCWFLITLYDHIYFASLAIRTKYSFKQGPRRSFVSFPSNYIQGLLELHVTFVVTNEFVV